MTVAGTAPRVFVVLSAIYLAGFIALYGAAVRNPLGQHMDASSLGVLGWLRTDGWLTFYGARDIVLYCVLGVAVVAALSATLEHRVRPVVCAGLLICVVAVGSVWLKDILPRPDLGDFAYAHNTYPSGHTATALAASVAIVWCRPRWNSRILVVVLAGLVSFVALGSVLSFAHRGADSIGGLLMAGAVSCAITAGGRIRVPAASRLRRNVAIGSIVALAAALLLLLAALGFFGGGDHANELSLAIVLSILALVASVLAVHRPFPVLRPQTPGLVAPVEGREGL